MIDIMLDYIRLTCYGTVILTSLNGILKKKFNNILFVGDVIVALGLMAVGLCATFFNINRALTSDVILTPIVIIWATIHFKNFLRYNGLDKKNSI